MGKTINGTSVVLLKKWIKSILKKIKKNKLYDSGNSYKIHMHLKTSLKLSIIENIFKVGVDHSVAPCLKKRATHTLKKHMLLVKELLH